MTAEELDLVESHELLDALGRRCMAYVFIQSIEDTDKTTAETLSWQGSFPTAIGLCHYGATQLETRQLQIKECDSCHELCDKYDAYCPHCGVKR